MSLRHIWAVLFFATSLIKLFFMEGESGHDTEFAWWTPIRTNGGDTIAINESAIDVDLIKRRLDESSRDARDRSWEKSYRVPHFFLHAPKTGGFSLHNQLNKMLWNSPVYGALPREDRFRACNLGKTKLRNSYPETDYKKGVKCNGFVSGSLSLFRDPLFLLLFYAALKHTIGTGESSHTTTSSGRSCRKPNSI